MDYDTYDNYEPYEDDLLELSNREAWEDAQADMEALHDHGIEDPDPPFTVDEDDRWDANDGWDADNLDIY